MVSRYPAAPCRGLVAPLPDGFELRPALSLQVPGEHNLRNALVAFGTWELNGLLAILYTAWERGAALMAAGAFAVLLFWTPPGRRSAHPVRARLLSLTSSRASTTPATESSASTAAT